jgi:hypothetical protein
MEGNNNQFSRDYQIVRQFRQKYNCSEGAQVNIKKLIFS